MRPSEERKLLALEAEYRASLKAALEQCVAGRYGLFGHNDRALEQLGKHARAKLINRDVEQLLELGSEIDRLRSRLGYTEPFALHQRLMTMRSSRHANTPGEPILARQWLDEMAG